MRPGWIIYRQGECTVAYFRTNETEADQRQRSSVPEDPEQEKQTELYSMYREDEYDDGFDDLTDLEEEEELLTETNKQEKHD